MLYFDTVRALLSPEERALWIAQPLATQFPSLLTRTSRVTSTSPAVVTDKRIIQLQLILLFAPQLALNTLLEGLRQRSIPEDRREVFSTSPFLF